MDIKDIQYFICIFEEKNFTKASERIHVVQSALSTRIRGIEERYNVTLFERTPSGLIPTQAGQHLYELCVPIAKSIAEANQEMIDFTSGRLTSGILRIGINSPMCSNILSHVLSKFSEMYPKYDIAVSEGYARDITEQVQAGILDVGLGALPLGETSLAWTHGFTDRYVLVAGRPIHGPTLTPIGLSEMREMTIVLPSMRHLLRETMSEHMASGRFRPKKIVTITGMVATLESIRDTEWGAVALMNSVLDRIDSPDFYVYPIVDPEMYLDLYIIHDLHRPLALPARRFVEMLRDRLKEMKKIWSESSLLGS